MIKTFWEAVKNRHSIYGLSEDVIVPRARIEQIVRDALHYLPSSYNSQSTCILLLFEGHHKALWKLTLEELKKVTPPERYAKTERKVNDSFAAGYGTVLFYEDQSVTDGLVASFPLYADKFPVWAQHTNAMHQFAVWTALEAEGLGASLQHYNPLIDKAVAERWNIPESWKLVAQMPFGKPTAPAGEKPKKPMEGRLKVFG